jgi:hypothetical protein
VEAEGRRFKSRGPLVFLRIFISGTESRINNAYSLRRGRRLLTIREIAFYNCNCNVRKKIKPPQRRGKL